MSTSSIPTDAGHLMFMQHWMEPRWVLPRDAAQCRSCPWRDILLLLIIELYRIFSQENISIPKGHTQEKFLMHS